MHQINFYIFTKSAKALASQYIASACTAFNTQVMRYVLSIFLLLNTVLLNAQGFRSRQYLPNAQNNTAKAIYEINPGNYIAIGIVVEVQQGHLSNRLCVMGLDNQGHITWHKKYGNYKFEYLDNILITRWAYKQNDHLYYTCSVKDSVGKYSGVLLKFDLNGDTLWQKIYRDAGEDVAPQQVTGSVDGGFLITGFFQNWNANSRPGLLIKTDANGNELWRKKINKSGHNVQDGKAIIQDTASKKIIIGGYQYIGNPNNFSIHDNIVVTDSLGNVITRRNYSGGGFINDLIQTKDKKIVAVGIIHAGYNSSLGGDLIKSFAVKFDIDAINPIWTLSHDKAMPDNTFTSIHELNNGDLIFGGLMDTTHNNYLTRLTKVNSNGSVLWNGYYNYKKNNNMLTQNLQRILCINPTSDGGIVAALENMNTSPNPFFFVKFDSNGCDTTLAYCAAVAAGISSSKIGTDEISIYPNPTQGNLTIDLESLRTGDLLTATIIDIYGKEIKQMQLEKNNKLDLRILEDGVYILQIKTNTNELVYQTKILKQH